MEGEGVSLCLCLLGYFALWDNFKIFVPPEQGDGRGGGEGEAERPMAAFGQTLSLIYVRVIVTQGHKKLRKRSSSIIAKDEFTFMSVIECKAASGPGPGLGDPPWH